MGAMCYFVGEGKRKRYNNPQHTASFEHYKNSVIYSSSYSNDLVITDFFAFEFPSYYEVEKLLHQESINRIQFEEITPQIRKHLEQIKIYEAEIQKYLSKQSLYSQTESQIVINLGNSLKNQENIKNQSQLQNSSNTIKIQVNDNIINLQILAIKLFQSSEFDQCLGEYENYKFQIYFNSELVQQFSGQIINGIMKPSPQLNKVRVDLNKFKNISEQSMKNEKYKYFQPKIKIISEHLQSTIICSQNTFRHIFPVVQMANLHFKDSVKNSQFSKQVRLGGKIYFRIQKIESFKDHAFKIFKLLQNRKNSLQELLNNPNKMYSSFEIRNTIYDEDFSYQESFNIPYQE